MREHTRRCQLSAILSNEQQHFESCTSCGRQRVRTFWPFVAFACGCEAQHPMLAGAEKLNRRHQGRQRDGANQQSLSKIVALFEAGHGELNNILQTALWLSTALRSSSDARLVPTDFSLNL